MVRLAEILTLLILLVNSIGADEPEWLSGKDLDRARMLGISADWVDSPLRSQLEKLSRNGQIAVFIDRRVDPNKEATFSMQDATWDQLVWALAERYEIGVCRLDDVYYFGPVETCRQLPILYEELRGKVTASRKKHHVDWRKRTCPQWPRLSNPSNLLNTLANENGLEFLDSDAIHFDVWPAHQLPRISLLQQTVLLAVGFNRWIELSSDGGQVTLVPFPVVQEGVLTIRDVSRARQTISQLGDDFPSCELKALGRSVVVKGPTREIARLQEKLVQLQTADVGDRSRHRFSMVDTTAKRGEILASIARTLELELSYPTESRESLEILVEISVRNVTAEEILDKVLAGTNLKYEIKNRRLIITRR